jgi:hypothetical protein
MLPCCFIIFWPETDLSPKILNLILLIGQHKQLRFNYIFNKLHITSNSHKQKKTINQRLTIYDGSGENLHKKHMCILQLALSTKNKKNKKIKLKAIKS